MIRPIILITSLFSLPFWLAGCSSVAQKDHTNYPRESLFESVETSEVALDPLVELQQQIKRAQQNKDWGNFISLSETLWSQVDASNQIAIEYQVWSQLNQLDDAQLNDLKAEAEDSPSILVDDWLALVDITRQHPVWQSQALKDLADVNPNAAYSQHLIPQLVEKLKQPYLVHQIAVMLPFNGPYAEISQQIRNGILKHLYQHAQARPDLRIQFYDSSETDAIQTTYQTAVQQGAEWVIGPLTKEALQQLAPLQPKNLIALNQIDDAFAQQFSYKSESEAYQIAQQLCRHQHQRIGILTSTAGADAELAQALAGHWQDASGQQAILKTYPTRNPNLRKALGSVINETQSQARKNNLRWLFGEKITFTPRIRQDLDAIVLIGNTRRLAVFRPQFKFFQLNLPTYGTSRITPAQLLKTAPNKDLSKIIYPTLPAAYTQTPLDTPFEAFGWDSLTLVLSQNKLAPGVCLNNGMMGQLSRNDHHIDHHYRWAQYNHQGRTQAFVDTPAVDETESSTADAEETAP